MTLIETDDPTIRIDAAQGFDPLTDTLTVLVTVAAGSTVFLEARSPVFPNKGPKLPARGPCSPATRPSASSPGTTAS